jgi:tetratricopeptide (TPR) repeat protein
VKERPPRTTFVPNVVSSVVAVAVAIAIATTSNPGTALAQYLRTFDEAMSFGEQGLATEHWDDAVYGFTCATDLEPESEGAWIGLQLATLSEHRWIEARRAGERALALSPQNLWARRKQALILYQLGEYEDAESLYRSVLVDAPDDAEMQLGLGFTLVRRGEEERGHAVCELAQQSLNNDPRVPQCLALRAPPKFTAGGSLELGAQRQTSSLKTRTLGSITGSVWGTWPFGLTLWGGGSLSSVDTSTQSASYTQATPTLGAGLTHDGAFVRLAATWLLSSYTPLDGATVLSTTFGYEGERWSTWLSGSSSFYGERTVNQWRAALRWGFAPGWSLRVGPEFTVVAEDDSVEWMGAGVAALRWDPMDRLWFELEGWSGARRYPVESEGLSVWTGDERFRGGARFDMGWLITDTLTGTFGVGGNYGDEQEGQKVDFRSLDASVGLRVAF